MLSAEGRCKTLDASADGYVRAEGAGCVILLRADAPGAAAAMAAGVVALLAGSAVNQDGRSSSLTAPNGPAQQVHFDSWDCSSVTRNDLCMTLSIALTRQCLKYSVLQQCIRMQSVPLSTCD